MKNRGFTLIEMMVAIAVFTSVVAAGSGIFISTLRAQRTNLASYEIMNQVSYVMEYMSRAIRMAKKDLTGACTGTAKLNYKFENQCLKFVNYKDACQQFCLVGSRLRDENGNDLTGANLQVNFFNVILSGASQPPTDLLQPRVTISLSVAGRENSSMKIQTTISQRNPDVRQ
jgi:prepilin-type N-terminal cleavage/methylation domain-containing protein